MKIEIQSDENRGAAMAGVQDRTSMGWPSIHFDRLLTSSSSETSSNVGCAIEPPSRPDGSSRSDSGRVPTLRSATTERRFKRSGFVSGMFNPFIETRTKRLSPTADKTRHSMFGRRRKGEPGDEARPALASAPCDGPWSSHARERRQLEGYFNAADECKRD